MGYTALKNQGSREEYPKFTLEDAALTFIRESCEGLRFDPEKAAKENFEKMEFFGTSLKEKTIPYNMQMDIDRLCLEKAVSRFLKSGKKEDAFDVYFCYLEMFVGDYEKNRRMIELLSEYEANGGGLLMKHRDHYSHSVYVFVLGLAIYQSNEIYREEYKAYYKLEEEHQAAHHYLQYWGLTSLFHDIGYPFELPFEQVASYFEVEGNKRKDRPFMSYRKMNSFISIGENGRRALEKVLASKEKTALEKMAEEERKTLGETDEPFRFPTTNELFACVLENRLGEAYSFTKEQMLEFLNEKPTQPDKFNHFMDHAYFSATVLFRKLFDEIGCELRVEHLDALTAILMHNSLYKFCIAHYKDAEKNIPLKAKLHPLAYMLMLCDELQCWDRTAYGRNSRVELHPMSCQFDFSENKIKAVYLYDEKENGKINYFKDAYIDWLQSDRKKENRPSLKAYAGMFIKNSAGISDFQEDIERIVDLSEIKLHVETGLMPNIHAAGRNYLSDSNFLNLYNFAMVLNGRWGNAAWKKAKLEGREEKFLSDENVKKEFSDSFRKLSLEYKLSNINQAKAFAGYMEAIDGFYTDKPVDFEVLEHFSEEELIKIGYMEHRRWLQEHYDMGWEYGTPEKEKRDLVRQHKDMIPGFDPRQGEVTEEQAKEHYYILDKAEQDKDTDPMECMLTMLKMFDGLRIYRLNS